MRSVEPGRIWDGSSRDGIALSGTCALGNRMGTASASQSHGVTLTARARGSGDETHRQVVAGSVCRASSCSANVNRNCSDAALLRAAGVVTAAAGDGPLLAITLWRQMTQFRLTRPDGLVGHWRANRVAVHLPLAGEGGLRCWRIVLLGRCPSLSRWLQSHPKPDDSLTTDCRHQNAMLDDLLTPRLILTHPGTRIRTGLTAVRTHAADRPVPAHDSAFVGG